MVQTLQVIRTWQTKVDVCLITDNEGPLQLVLDRWALDGVAICPFKGDWLRPDESKYSLLVCAPIRSFTGTCVLQNIY